MRYEYRQNAISSRKIDVGIISGLSYSIQLEFGTCYLRLYKSEDDPASFYCCLAIPKFKDDEGYVLELNFSNNLCNEPESHVRDERYYEPQYDPDADAIVNICEYEPELEFVEGFFDTYTSPSCGIGFNDLAQSAVFSFTEKMDRGQHILLLTLKISGTPYYGYTLIEHCFYKRSI